MPGTKGLTFVSWNKIALGKPCFADINLRPSSFNTVSGTSVPFL